MKLVVVFGLYLGARALILQDNVNRYPLTGSLQSTNDMLRDVHQVHRKTEWLSKANGDVLELNAGSGKTVHLLPPFVSRYYANETNPYLTTVVQKQLQSHGLPIHHVENCDSLQLLKQLDSDSLDNIIMNGALRYEKNPNKVNRLIQETHRVLRPGGVLYFCEDVEYSPQQQIAPLKQARTALRNFVLNETTHNIVPTLLDVYHSAYVEDWSRPNFGYDASPREHVKVMLPYNQRQSAADNLAQFNKNIPPYDFGVLHRPLLAGYAIKKTTTDRSQHPIVMGYPNMDMLMEVRDCYNLKELDRQAMREQTAAQQHKEMDAKLLLEQKKAQDREQFSKPTLPKGGYEENFAYDLDNLNADDKKLVKQLHRIPKTTKGL